MVCITKWGNSQGIRIPKKYLKEAGLDIGDIVEIKVENSKIVLEPVKRHKRIPKLKIEEVFKEQMEQKSEFDWDKQGKEIW